MTETLAAPPTPRSRRIPVLVILVAVAVAGGLLDRLPRPSAGEGGAARVATMPLAAPRSSLSSSWFCAGATASAGGVANGTLLIANAGTRTLTGTVTVVPDQGDPHAVPVTVAAGSRAVVRESDVVTASYVAGLVELDGGEVVVEQQIDGPLGLSTAPCASAASDHWYLAEGSTARQEGAAAEDAMLLALYNPFPEDAIVDLSFSTEDGRRVPSEFTGLVVPGGRLLMVNVADHVRRRQHIAVTAVSRSGRIVVDRLQVRNGAVKGISLVLAAPSPGTEWHFAEGLVADGITESYHLYNPTAKEAEVSLTLSLEQGSAEPFDLTIPPRDRLTVVADQEERVPHGVAHAATVTSNNGVPVVVERSIAAVSPATRLGATDALGVREAARRWVLASGAATSTLDEWVVLSNPGSSGATVAILRLAGGQAVPIQGAQAIRLPAGKRTAVRMTDLIGGVDQLPLLVRSTSPIVVERGLYAVGGPGLAVSSGVALR